MTKNRLRAEEARRLSNAKDPEFIVDEILDRVRSAAEDGRNYLVVREYGFGNDRYYVEPLPDHLKRVITILRSLEYNVQHATVEGQFVDMYLKIEW